MTTYQQIFILLCGVLTTHLVDRLIWQMKMRQEYRLRIFDRRFEAYLRVTRILWGHQVIEEPSHQKAALYSLVDGKFIDEIDIFKRFVSSSEDFRLIATEKTTQALWKLGKYLVAFKEEADKQPAEKMMEKYGELSTDLRNSMRKELGIDVLAEPDQMQEVFGKGAPKWLYLGEKGNGI